MSRFVTASFLVLAAALAACESSDSPFEPSTPTATLTVDASASFAYVDLNGGNARLVSVVTRFFLCRHTFVTALAKRAF